MSSTSNRYCTKTASSRRRASSSRRRTSPAWRPYRRAVRRGRRATSRASGRASRARTLLWNKPFTKTLDESNAPFYKWFDDGELNASYNCLDRNVEHGNGDKTAIIFEADDGKVTQVTYQRAATTRVCQLRQRAEGAAASRRATASSSTCRCRSRAWSRCRPARASAPRTRWCSAASRRSALQERIVDAGAVAVITADEQLRGGKELPLKADRRRGARAWAAATAIKQRHRLPAHRRQRRRCRRGARPVAGTTSSQGQADTCEPEVGRRRASAVHPLHLGLDRQAQGRAALAPAATCCGRC